MSENGEKGVLSVYKDLKQEDVFFSERDWNHQSIIRVIELLFQLER